MVEICPLAFDYGLPDLSALALALDDHRWRRARRRIQPPSAYIDIAIVAPGPKLDHQLYADAIVPAGPAADLPLSEWFSHYDSLAREWRIMSQLDPALAELPSGYTLDHGIDAAPLQH